jgi:hypothetical protein
MAATGMLHTGIRGNSDGNTQGCIQIDVRDVPQDALIANKRKVNRKEKNTCFLEGCGIPSCCLGLHPIHKRPPSLKIVDEVTRALDGDMSPLSRLTHLRISDPWP